MWYSVCLYSPLEFATHSVEFLHYCYKCIDNQMSVAIILLLIIIVFIFCGISQLQLRLCSLRLFSSMCNLCPNNIKEMLYNKRDSTVINIV